MVEGCRCQQTKDKQDDLLLGLPSYRFRVVSHVERVAVEQILANARACTCHPLVSLNWLSADTNSDESVCRLPRNQGSNVALSPCLYSVGSPSESYLALWGVVRGGPLLLKPLAVKGNAHCGWTPRTLACLSQLRSLASLGYDGKSSRQSPGLQGSSDTTRTTLCSLSLSLWSVGGRRG